MKKIRGKETDTKDKEFEKKIQVKLISRKKIAGFLWTPALGSLAWDFGGLLLGFWDVEFRSMQVKRSWMADMSSRETERLNWDFVLGGWVWDFDGRSLVICPFFKEIATFTTNIVSESLVTFSI
ncbi:uncharacterized protein OCT59_007551 [Rhizophagus irregularis]|uniref:uncharacterized protein n=1 Tax=Rhizophagus irregularis TaxID=588596 RepID=UPI00332D5C28|nr:hypothetical protein OCT59_007551 [Rhizophagus irregularis]